MSERLKVKIVVLLVWEREGKYLFSKRIHTGYCDGFYTIPAGHIDAGEVPRAALVREVKEEIGLQIAPDDLEFVHALYSKDQYAHYYFQLRKAAVGYTSEPRNTEPEKCERLCWASLEELKEEIIPSVYQALLCILKGVPFSEVEEGF